MAHSTCFPTSPIPGFGYQSELELRVAEAARRQYNKLKMQTKAEIRQTIDQLLVGEFIVRHKLPLPLHYGQCKQGTGGWGQA